MVSSRKLSSEEVDALIEGLQSDEMEAHHPPMCQKLLTSDPISLGQMSYHY
ncbi:MAG: hypothetical protein CM15mP98_09840 [Paracoccaceae bacterium]|nr:MAG: hypothetical protein CM15mP98_09840 [Paracoccaceae bacterium]